MKIININSNSLASRDFAAGGARLTAEGVLRSSIIIKYIHPKTNTVRIMIIIIILIIISHLTSSNIDDNNNNNNNVYNSNSTSYSNNDNKHYYYNMNIS